MFSTVQSLVIARPGGECCVRQLRCDHNSPENKHRNPEKPKNETETATNFRKAQNTQKSVKSRKGETEKTNA